VAADWEDLAEATSKALAAPPETWFEISARIAAGKRKGVPGAGR